MTRAKLHIASNRPLGNWWKRRSRACRCCLLLSVLSALAVGLFVAFFLGVPVLFNNSVAFQRSFLFRPDTAPRETFEKITDSINGSRTFYISVNGITLGAWHFLPEALIEDSRNASFDYDRALSSNHSVVVHFHGYSGNRAEVEYLRFFQRLRKTFHVISFDYRSYGDSSAGEMSEEGMVRDSVEFYKAIRKLTGDSPYVWGHSLGAAIATHTVRDLKNESIVPMGLILEAPFNNLRDRTVSQPFARLFTWLPWFLPLIYDGLEKNGFFFNSSSNIQQVDCPILILHAEDDPVNIYDLGKKLYETAKSTRLPQQGNVTFVSFPAELQYGHSGIMEAPDLDQIISNFTESCEEYKTKRQ